MKIKTTTVTFVGSFLLWIGLNSSIKTDVLVVGGVISAILATFFTKKGLFETISFKTPFACIRLIFSFSFELVKSNIDIALRVISPSIRINPAIVKVKTKLKSDIGRLALANAITLTPGTLTTEIEDNTLYIHWIDATSTDVEGATKAIVSKFEKHLEVIFG